MIPTGLKIGDVFEEPGRHGVIRNVIIGFDGQGNYISKPFESEAVVPVEDVIEEELPFTMPDDELVEEQPIVEEVKKEVKKPAPKRTAKKKPTSKKK
ncbi:MAG: hypothetical protein J6Y09_08385 [Lachnospiraceae bacterium]|nr:hypothetical protein [Lachnospiraceae bacterium]